MGYSSCKTSLIFLFQSNILTIKFHYENVASILTFVCPNAPSFPVIHVLETTRINF